ncbi:MAG: PilZ domain-containing protein [Thiotrichaceae bacterium]
MSESRRFYRHHAEMPIEVWSATEEELAHSQARLQCTKNISLGGLSFESATKFQKGTVLGVRILMMTPPVEVLGRVAWCAPGDNGQFDIGIEFLDGVSDSSEQVVEEACQVEVYKGMLQDIAHDMMTHSTFDLM